MTGPGGLDLDDAGVVLSGAAVFVLAFFPWYETPGGLIAVRGWGLGPASVFAAILAAYAAGRVLLLRGRPPKPDVPVTPQAETFVVACVALALMVYRLLVAPDIEGVGTERTLALTLAAGAVLLEAVFAARKLGRTGVRAAG